MELKYVITEHNNFAIFSKGTNHGDIGKELHGDPVGAGFCTLRKHGDLDNINIHCYGESISLGIESREEDEKIINKALNNY